LGGKSSQPAPGPAAAARSCEPELSVACIAEPHHAPSGAVRPGMGGGPAGSGGAKNSKNSKVECVSAIAGRRSLCWCACGLPHAEPHPRALGRGPALGIGGADKWRAFFKKFKS